MAPPDAHQPRVALFWKKNWSPVVPCGRVSPVGPNAIQDRSGSSLKPQNAQDCSVAGAQASMAKTANSSAAKDQVTRITFERRFSPGEKLNTAALQPGDTLLGSSVMALAIDGAGSVKGCRVVSTAGTLPPQYGCDEASAERFEASAKDAHAQVPPRAGYMTVLVYGHSEHVV
jgi:hypothetical protein